MPKRLRWNEKQYQIYALIDPIDDLAHYVGKSEDAQSRFVGHLHGVHGNDGEQRWIMSLRKKGLSPTLEILETIDESNDTARIVREREHYWIREMVRLGHPLLNVYGVKYTYWHPSAHKSSKGHISRNAGITGDASALPIRVNKQIEKNDEMMTDYLNITDVARELGVNDRTVRRWIKSGELHATRDIVGRYRISRVDLEDFRRRRMERFSDGGDIETE